MKPGKRILELQGNFALLHSPRTVTSQIANPDPYERTPFQHPALEGLQNLTSILLSELLTKDRLGHLASSYGISQVTRWKPRNVSALCALDILLHMLIVTVKPANLDGSGQNVVYTTSLYAILGALALQKGGDFANQVARDKVLKPLGI
jgi:large subunit ribosomal protein L15